MTEETLDLLVDDTNPVLASHARMRLEQMHAENPTIDDDITELTHG